MAVLLEERGKQPASVFTFDRRPRKSVNTKSWKKGLKRAGIENFRWHDVRHVWATWDVMAGTTLGELQELGAWKSETMVKRYAHFAPEQLRRAADRPATFWSTDTKQAAKENAATHHMSGTHACLLVGRTGFEPVTNGLKVRCSTRLS